MENCLPQTNPTTIQTSEVNVLKECSNCLDRLSPQNETSQKETATVSEEKTKPTNEKSQNESTKTEKAQENNDEELKYQPKGSLQEHFEKFRKKRMEKVKYKSYLKQIKEKDRSSQEFRDELRLKFIETAKKYYGIPYAKRFLQPGEPHYDSPLFLDCCGLVRQIVYDLREDFGFSLQRWNQSYQFDTLPNSVNFEDLKPGDLIFYSGTYYDPKKRKQKHDMTHVEIFIGGPTGEQSIGARWTKGVVQLFDSYKFVSKSYYDIKFYYKSIDTWLNGICQSTCQEHPWRDDRDLWVSDKYSVFANEEDAGDDECEDGEAPEETKKQSEEVKVDKTEKKARQNKGPRQVYVGKGNNDKLIKDFFSGQEGYVVMDQKHAFSTKFDVKWVQTTSEIDYLSLKEGQLVNHIPNINIITNKKNLIQTLRDYEEIGDGAKNSDVKLSDIMTPTFRLDKLTDEILFINHQSEGLWISKPQNNNQGKGLRIIRDIQAFKKDFIESKKFLLGEFATNEVFGKLEKTKETIKENQNDEFRNIGCNTIIQKYIENPLLLNKRKFDIRCFALIASTKPFVVLYSDGYIRLSLKEYNLNVQEFDKVMHLTNNAIQKKFPGYSEMKEESIWSMTRFSEYLEKELSISKEKQEEVSAKIKKIVLHVVKSAEKKLDKRVGFFELLGFDIMIDADLNPYLLEVNTNPALFLDTKVQGETLPKIVNSTLELVLSLNKEPEKIAEVVQSLEKEKLGPFEMIYNSANI